MSQMSPIKEAFIHLTIINDFFLVFEKCEKIVYGLIVNRLTLSESKLMNLLIIN